MLSRIFGEAEKPLRDMADIRSEEMLTLAKQYFYSNYSICEVDSIWKATQALLSELSIDDENFDKRFDEIILGTIILARVIAQWHGEFHSNLYDKTFKELGDLFNVQSVSLLGNSAEDPGLRTLITSIGDKVMTGELPFKAEYFNHVTLAQKHIPMLQRLNVYRPEIALETQTLTAREKAFIKLVAEQRQEISSLKQSLDTAKSTIAELTPKAQWHDEEQQRRQDAEAEKAYSKKHPFSHFSRKHK